MQRSEKLDWQKISKIDPVLVETEHEDEVSKIKEIMLNIALCSLEEEFGKDLLENGRNLLNLSLFRVSRISQLIIQYLLHNEVCIYNLYSKLKI